MALNNPTGNAIGSFSVTNAQPNGPALSQDRCEGVSISNLSTLYQNTKYPKL